MAALCRHRDVQELLIHSNQQKAGEGKKSSQHVLPKEDYIGWDCTFPPSWHHWCWEESLASVELLPQAQYSVLNKWIFQFAPSNTWRTDVVLELEI